MVGSGLDFVFIDTEHIPLNRETVSWMCRLYAGVGLAPIVRIPSPDENIARQVIDGGAAGIVAPYVETVEEVELLRGAVKMRPLKAKKLKRILKGKEVLAGHLKSYIAQYSHEPLLLINIESVPAIENLETILSVPDLDGTLIGPHDLSCSLGIPEQYEHPDLTRALKKIVRQTRNAGLIAGLHFMECGPVELACAWVRMGVNFHIQQADIAYCRQGICADLQRIRENC